MIVVLWPLRTRRQPPVSRNPLRRPARLAKPPNSGVGCYQMGCRGLWANLRPPGNTPLGSTDSFVAQTRWGIPPGHMLGVHFATREPAAVIQTVVHCMLQNRFAGFRIRRVAGKHIGSATSRVRHLPNHRTHDTHVNSTHLRAISVA